MRMRISRGWMTHRLGEGLVEGLALSVGFMDIGATPEVVTDPIMSDTPLEDAPGFLKRRLMRVLLRDVHFLFDAEFSPRPGVTFHIRQEIRRRMLDATWPALSVRGHTCCGPQPGQRHRVTR